MDILQCLRKYGQRLDSEIAEETGVALAKVRERFALLTGTGEVITCKLTRFEKGKPVDACLYRASGYFPPPAPGRNRFGLARPRFECDGAGPRKFRFMGPTSLIVRVRFAS
jgi:hypothetical protein